MTTTSRHGPACRSSLATPVCASAWKRRHCKRKQLRPRRLYRAIGLRIGLPGLRERTHQTSRNPLTIPLISPRSRAPQRSNLTQLGEGAFSEGSLAEIVAVERMSTHHRPVDIVGYVFKEGGAIATFTPLKISRTHPSDKCIAVSLSRLQRERTCRVVTLACDLYVFAARIPASLAAIFLPRCDFTHTCDMRARCFFLIRHFQSPRFRSHCGGE